jgi:hypothetical protein
MAIRIVDHKCLDMTDEEFELYQKIAASYTTANNRGEDLFQDLWESDDNGIILFLKPPSTRRTTFEVFLFLMSIQQQQQIRLMYQQVEDICFQMKTKMNELNDRLQKLDDSTK